MSQLRGDEPDLALGDSGEGVVELQVRLYRLGLYPQLPDGTYDMVTENAVRDLQSQTGQDNTGEVTRTTWEGIVYWEQQRSLDYQYQSPYDALAQLRHDLEHAEDATGPASSADPSLSADGQWRWDGTDWQPAVADERAGQLSEDGQWRWDGSDWQPAVADDYVGQLSPDGYWRWNGREWVAT